MLQRRHRERVEQVEHDRCIGEYEVPGVHAHRSNGETLLRIAAICADIFLGNMVQGRQQFHANDPLERIVRGHQQSATLAGTQVDKWELSEIDWESLHHLAKRTFLGSLIKRVERTDQAITEAHGGAGSVHAVLPVVIDVAIPLALPCRGRVVKKIRHFRYEHLQRSPEAIACSVLHPPFPQRLCERESRVRGGRHCWMLHECGCDRRSTATRLSAYRDRAPQEVYSREADPGL